MAMEKTICQRKVGISAWPCSGVQAEAGQSWTPQGGSTEQDGQLNNVRE